MNTIILMNFAVSLLILGIGIYKLFQERTHCKGCECYEDKPTYCGNCRSRTCCGECMEGCETCGDEDCYGECRRDGSGRC